MSNPRRNSYPGTCARCHTAVEPQQGFIQKENGKWTTYCNSTACLPSSIRNAVSAVNARPHHTITNDGKIYTPYNPDTLPLLRSIPGARWSKEDGCWTFSLEVKDRRRVLEIAAKLNLTVAPGLEDFSYGAEVDALLNRARAKGAYHFQLDGVAHLASRKRSLLGDDMGTGKTVQTLLALPDNAAVICVVPACVKYNWQNECNRWRPDITPIITPIICDGKTFRAPQPGEMVIINPEGLPAWLGDVADAEINITVKGETKTVYYPHKSLDNYREQATKHGVKINSVKKIKYGKPYASPNNVKALERCILVADEAHMYKNVKAMRTKKLTCLATFCAQTVTLTGTPLLTRPLDLWGVLSAFGMAWEVFGSWQTFLRLFEGTKSHWGGYTFGDPSPEVAERLRRVMLRRTKAEVWTDMPQKVYQRVEVNGIKTNLAKALDAVYAEWSTNTVLTKLREKCHDAISADDWYICLALAGDHEIAADYVRQHGCPYTSKAEAEQHIHTSSTVLDANVPLLLPDFSRFSAIRAELAEARIPAMLEMVEAYEDAGNPLIVASAHKAPIHALQAREGWAIITGDTSPQERAQIVERFQAGALKGIGCTIQAAGVGLTLTRSSNMLFVDYDWTPALNIQMEDRIHRFGQAESCNYTIMHSSHVLDRHITRLIAKKMDMMRVAVDGQLDAVEAPVEAPAIVLDEETDVEQSNRVLRFQNAREAQRQQQRNRDSRNHLAEWVDRYGSQDLDVTPAVDQAVTAAMGHMLSVCDGAVAKDYQGFNAPDAARARRLEALMNAADHTDAERVQIIRLVHGMLRKYRNTQLDSFGLTF